jgi:hypothetical protein
LIDDLSSRSSVADVRQRLVGSGLSFERVEGSRAAPQLPPYAHDVYRVPEYRTLGHNGELRLFFFNDRLMQTIFYPQEPSEFRMAVAKRYPGWDGKLDVPSHTRVESARDAEGRQYVSWIDLGLLSENDAWIRDHS